MRRVFDVILIDCPPGLSVLTECWLREADFHISPTKADYVSVCGLEVFRRFKGLNPEMGFAENLGVIVNMKEAKSVSDEEYHRWLQDNAENACFAQAIPRMPALQDAAQLRPVERSYMAKYPGEFERRHPCRLPGAVGPARCRQRQRGERIRGVVSSGGVGGVFLSGDGVLRRTATDGGVGVSPNLSSCCWVCRYKA